MNKIKLACFASILATGLAHAKGVPCDEFEIQVKNNSPDDFVVTSQITGAEFSPNGIHTLKAGTEETFTVNKSINNAEMLGTFELRSISLPIKTTAIKFTLTNKSLICYHDDKEITGPYKVNKTRVPNHVIYTIG